MTARSSTDYNITATAKLELEDILRQLNAVYDFPAILQVGNRVFPIANKEELWALKTGIEISWDLVLDKWDAGELKPSKAVSSPASTTLKDGIH